MRRLLMLILCLLLMRPHVCLAVLGIGDITIVSDPQGLFQQVLQVGESVKTNAALVQQYQALLNQYAQDAKAFVSIPQSVLASIQGISKDYLDLLQTGQTLGYTLSGITQQFDTLYQRGAWSGNALTTATSMLQAVRDAGRVATQISSLYTILCTTLANKTTQLALSRTSIGQLSAQQATNELLGTMIDQQTTIQALHVTANRLQMTYYMQQTIEQEAVVNKAAHWLDGWPTSSATEHVILPGN